MLHDPDDGDERTYPPPSLDASVDILLEDDVDELKKHIRATGLDIHAVYSDHVDHMIDFDTSLLLLAVVVNAVKCVRWLRSQGVDASSRMWPHEDLFFEASIGPVTDAYHTPLQMAVLLHGSASDMARALRHDGWKKLRTTVRIRSIALYWWELTRHRMAPGGSMFDRDHASYETEFG